MLFELPQDSNEILREIALVAYHIVSNTFMIGHCINETIHSNFNFLRYHYIVSHATQQHTSKLRKYIKRQVN